MDDLIKRSDAIEAIEVVDWYHQNRNKDMVSGANSNDHQAWYKADDVYKALEAIPSADRPQGEWIRTGRTNIYGGIEVQCSNCGDKVMVQHLEDEWFCRHCGADMGMKGADDE